VLKRHRLLPGELGHRRVATSGGPILVGFAAETQDVVSRASAKRERKHADFIVANDVSRADAGFDVETNAVTIIGPDGAETLPLQSKVRVAGEILNRVERLLAARPAPPCDGAGPPHGSINSRNTWCSPLNRRRAPEPDPA
jgi:phosphopantothenoylcysteine decarboxylase/phosphopantothenate--cysteine ligase